MCESSPSGSIFCEMGVVMMKEKYVEKKIIPADCRGAMLVFFLVGCLAVDLFIDLFPVISLKIIWFNHVL